MTQHGEFTVSVVSAMEIAYRLHRGARLRQFDEFEATPRSRGGLPSETDIPSCAFFFHRYSS